MFCFKGDNACLGEPDSMKSIFFSIGLFSLGLHFLLLLFCTKIHIKNQFSFFKMKIFFFIISFTFKDALLVFPPESLFTCLSFWSRFINLLFSLSKMSFSSYKTLTYYAYPSFISQRKSNTHTHTYTNIHTHTHTPLLLLL